MKKETEERFWSRVRFSDNCWEWTARLNPDGYGMLDYDNKSESAHRVSWRIHFGFIPSRLEVLHHCDNRKCVNPEHLFLGTQVDNIKDMFLKGRQRSHRGTKNNRARLTEKDVSEIKKLRRIGWQYRNIAEKFNVTVSCVSHILNGRHWSWIS